MSIKAQIITAALYVLRDGEKVSFSMRAVAKQAGKAPQELYRHFRDKQALSDTLVEEARRILTQYQLNALDQPTPFERMWKMGQQYVVFAIKHAELYQLLFVRPITGVAPHYPAQMGPELDLPFQMIVDRIRECMQEGDLKTSDPTQVALVAWSQAHGLCMLHHSGRFNADKLRLYSDMAFARLLDGIANPDSVMVREFNNNS